ncbi:MAG TPA: S8 family serine peptidase [Gaiellaceae bacterium]|nr:S8 family serine peptidase [Gaiellaceae bacterium]HET8652739.1 S8 family serine peptidase [Gaiellaceae bacterium]
MNGKGGSSRGEHRSSALWGTGNRGGDSRSNALWGKGGRGLVTALVAVLVVAAPLAAGARKGEGKRPLFVNATTHVDAILLAKAESQPDELVKVIIQGKLARGGVKYATEAFHQVQDRSGHKLGETLKDTYPFVDSVSATVRARKIYQLARVPGLTVTFDAPVKLSGTVTTLPTSKHLWTTASGVKPLWGNRPAAGEKMPAIAIVDSGIDKDRADFDGGARITDSVVFTKLDPNSPGDGRGHGTFVAGIAAGSARDQAGAAPQANLISLDVMDDNGMARTSDVIAAAEWIFENRATKNIKVANFSLHSTMPSNFINDPLDKAVEKLWFGGVTVVVAAGNYGKEGGPSGVPFAPGNDPFVITVGAVDLEGSVSTRRHDVPNWSAFGYTKDGFRKPELAAAGRYMIGPVPGAATLRAAKPDNVVDANYMRLSGTSFAAPVVAGAAALLLMDHPTWTPDQIKGALMQRARYIPEAPPGSAGVGEINAARSTLLTQPPNPNAALNRFVRTNLVNGSPEFDGTAWYTAAKASVSWDSVSWSDVSWTDVSWTDVSWSDVSWSDVSWTDVSWSDVLAAADVSWEDNAEGETANPEGDYVSTPEEEALAAELGLVDRPAATTETATP